MIFFQILPCGNATYIWLALVILDRQLLLSTALQASDILAEQHKKTAIFCCPRYNLVITANCLLNGIAPNMNQSPQSEKHFLQKVSGVCGVVSFLSSIICVVVLAIYSDEFTMVYIASFTASAIFFFSVGIVFKVMANTNLPKFHDNDSTEQ